MELLSIINKFKGKKVLVVGDLILDCFIWGKVKRISPEAPVPVVDVERMNYVLGGAANVAGNIVALGGSATVIGAIGDGPSGQRMVELIHNKNIHVIPVHDNRPTTVKTRVIAHNQQVVRFDQEQRGKLSSKGVKTIVEKLKEQIKKHDAVIVSDYKKGVICTEVMKAVLGAGKKFVAVDPKVGHFNLYKNVSIMTPNLKEASEGAGIEIRDEESLIRAGVKLMKKLSLKSLLITRGEQGMSLFHKSGGVHITTLAKHVYDVTGAGDTVIAALALSHAAGAGLEEASVIANHAAGIVVGEVGTAYANPDELKSSLKNLKPDLVRFSL
ncbi:D-glycero-beta-D-manno-heptose-7-phosphate kinase [Nitrospirota bacterium]